MKLDKPSVPYEPAQIWGKCWWVSSPSPQVSITPRQDKPKQATKCFPSQKNFRNTPVGRDVRSIWELCSWEEPAGPVRGPRALAAHLSLQHGSTGKPRSAGTGGQRGTGIGGLPAGGYLLSARHLSLGKKVLGVSSGNWKILCVCVHVDSCYSSV